MWLLRLLTRRATDGDGPPVVHPPGRGDVEHAMALARNAARERDSRHRQLIVSEREADVYRAALASIADQRVPARRAAEHLARVRGHASDALNAGANVRLGRA